MSEAMDNAKRELLDNAKYKSFPDTNYGGQTTGTPVSGIILTSEDAGFEIKISFYNQQYKNKNLARTIFELYLDETFK